MSARKGLTLVELILVVAIMGVVMAALVPYIRTIHRTWQYGDRRTEMLQHGRVSMDKMVRVIRSAKGIADIDSSGQGDYIGLVDESEESVIFFHNVDHSGDAGHPNYYVGETGNVKDNDLVMRTEDQDGNPVNSLLAKSLESLAFTYLKKTMDPQDPAITPIDVKAVKIEMALSDPEGELSGTLPVSSLAYRRPVTIAVWLAAGSQGVIKIDSNGIELLRVEGVFLSPGSVSVDTRDGSCWVADVVQGNSKIVKLDSDGTPRLTLTDFNMPRSVSVYPTDGSCWVADTENGRVVKLGSDGSIIRTIPGFTRPWSVSVDSKDGSCWVADYGGHAVVKLASDGTEVGRASFGTPQSVSVNSTDGSCWVADRSGGGAVVRLDSSGTQELARSVRPKDPWSVSVNPLDGSCWVADLGIGVVFKLDADARILEMIKVSTSPRVVSVNSLDGSCWVADTTDRQVIKLDSDGTELKRISDYHYVWSISVDTGER